MEERQAYHRNTESAESILRLRNNALDSKINELLKKYEFPENIKVKILSMRLKESKYLDEIKKIELLILKYPNNKTYQDNLIEKSNELSDILKNIEESLEPLLDTDELYDKYQEYQKEKRRLENLLSYKNYKQN